MSIKKRNEELNNYKAKSLTDRLKWCEAKFSAGTFLSKMESDELLATRENIESIRDFIKAVDRFTWGFDEELIPESIKAIDRVGLLKHLWESYNSDYYATDIDFSGESWSFDKYNITLCAMIANLVTGDDMFKLDDFPGKGVYFLEQEMEYPNIVVGLCCSVQENKLDDSKKVYYTATIANAECFLPDGEEGELCIEEVRALVFASLVQTFEVVSCMNKSPHPESIVKLEWVPNSSIAYQTNLSNLFD